MRGDAGRKASLLRRHSHNRRAVGGATCSWELRRRVGSMIVESEKEEDYYDNNDQVSVGAATLSASAESAASASNKSTCTNTNTPTPHTYRADADADRDPAIEGADGESESFHNLSLNADTPANANAGHASEDDARSHSRPEKEGKGILFSKRNSASSSTSCFPLPLTADVDGYGDTGSPSTSPSTPVYIPPLRPATKSQEMPTETTGTSVQLLDIAVRRNSFSDDFGFEISGGRDAKRPLLISNLSPNSPASTAGLRARDVVVQVEGIPAADLSHRDTVRVSVLLLGEGELRAASLLSDRPREAVHFPSG